MSGILETGDGLLSTEERPTASNEGAADTSVKTHVDDQLTEAELAYFKSGGQDVTGLLADNRYKEDVIARQTAEAATPASATPTPQATPAAPQATATPPAAIGETVPDGEEVDFSKVTEDPEGRLRDDRGRFVPHGALAKERARLKDQRAQTEQLAQENRSLNDNYTKLAERVAVLQEIWNKPKEPEAAPAPAPEPVAPPDPEVDIFAYSRWQAEQLKATNERLEQLSKKLEEGNTQVQQKMTEQGMLQGYREDAARFAAQKDDFSAAYTHLINQRHASLAMLGYTDADERARIINGEEKELVQTAYKRGMRPAEFIYNYAAATGYRPAAAPTPATTAPAPAAPTPVATAAPAPAAAPAPTEAERLINAQKAQAASATLSGTGGSASGEGLTAESLASMSEEQFAAIAAQLGKKGMRAYMGGPV